ncbi:general secretion pathway protein GspN [Pseudomonas sp. SWI6]|uniref:Type II secretion system protein N n=1 Tax=Pseudomonas taiwanensis TaxID=470150 RepID=A0ABR6V508_9PSED|nr:MULTISPECIES: type II secretion system protein N [Pseudomonas]AVD81899.1 general secretion pathway protein GspN [Pseudomonas sp. SWI6]AVD88851.1 general secretion pathway protein GspN [Pseudomonas sp. SWI44]MBC3475506.1 type II secretion system protein N [Pseudomonas taiwanensis]MBC3492019.1 type II secretion system protein N [Pseudomonas taiwanensis]MDT8922431.1 type II secretion system protein N [Pseudomonas taiwanensis]
MSRRGLLWMALVFGLTVLVELPASWVARASGAALGGVSGTLWHGQAQHWGAVGPLRWTLQPWRLVAIGELGYQGQAWQLRAEGWPWRWRLQVQATGAQATAQADYRLAGQWQGTLTAQGSGLNCQGSAGRLQAVDVAVSAPWSLALGQGSIELDCRAGWHLLGHLALQGQHQVNLDADLMQRTAQVRFQMQPDAALTPVLRGAQWMEAQATSGQRRLRW